MSLPPPHCHGHRKRLRERFVKNGLAGFVVEAALSAKPALVLAHNLSRRSISKPDALTKLAALITSTMARRTSMRGADTSRRSAMRTP